MSRDDLHAVLLEILSNIDEFCEKNNIRYSLGGGTLLGAVRHKGFIPWDDDVDIMMPRPDYNRFVSLFNGYNKNYQFIYAEKSKTVDTPHAYGKVHDIRTKIYEADSPTNKSGVYVDVFPIDGMPTNYTLCKLYMSFVTQFSQILYYKNRRFADLPTLSSRIKKLMSSFFTYKFLGRANTMVMSLFKYSTSTYAGAITGVYGMKERYPQSLFEHYTRIAFESKQFMSIKDFNTYLSQHYGDYMQIPPKEKQVNHQATAWWIS